MRSRLVFCFLPLTLACSDPVAEPSVDGSIDATEDSGYDAREVDAETDAGHSDAELSDAETADTHLDADIVFAGTEFFVNKSGDDANGCTNADTDACLTIQRGISELAPGDVLTIGPGVYRDDGGASPFLTPGTPTTFESTPTTVTSFNVIFDRSGTAALPIVVRADPRASEPVVIDAEHVRDGNQSRRGGIFMNYQDFIHIRGVTIRNCLSKGIGNWDHPGETPRDDALSVGVVIDGVTVHHVGGGDNDTGIGMYSTRDWVVRNTRIFDIYSNPSAGRVGSGILSYGTINALIEHSTIDANGSAIFWKDHYVEDADTRAPVFESEIRYNVLRGERVGLLVSIQGAGTGEAGANYVHHNIITGVRGTEGAGVLFEMSGASHETTAQQRIEHNLFLGLDPSDSSAVAFSATSDVRLAGNLFFGFSRAITTQRVRAGKHVVIASSDRNVFDPNRSSVLLDRYSSGAGYPAISYDTLMSWQNALSEESSSLAFDAPDTSSASAPLDDVVLLDDVRVSYPDGSVALGRMEDGSNAGPLQTGAETFGAE